jgi:hypothetical protein
MYREFMSPTTQAIFDRMVAADNASSLDEEIAIARMLVSQALALLTAAEIAGDEATRITALIHLRGCIDNVASLVVQNSKLNRDGVDRASLQMFIDGLNYAIVEGQKQPEAMHEKLKDLVCGLENELTRRLPAGRNVIDVEITV